MKSTNGLLTRTTLYAPHFEYSDMIEQIQNYVKMSHLPIWIALFTSKKDAFEYFNKEKSGELSISEESFNNNIYVGELYRKYGRIKENIIRGRFLLFKHNKYDIYLILTHEGTNFFKNGLLKFIEKKYPIFSSPYFYSWEIETMLNHLAKTTPQNRIMLTKISQKSRIRSEVSRKSKESDLKWTDLPYKDEFRRIREGDAWIEKVYLDFIAEIKNDKGFKISKVLSAFISREGTFKCELEFKLFFSSVVESSIEIFFRRKKQFSNRARVKETNYKSKPIFIEFEEPIFKDKNNNVRLIEILKNLTHTANSILHDNPYVHVTLIDYIDNSNFEIWVLSNNRISIVPQTVCSMSSLNRLCNHISKEFQEGTIKETLGDL